MREIRYADRWDAGVQLAGMLESLKSSRPLVLALPRGGVPVAAAVAERLGADLDVLVPEPGARELFRDLRAEGFAIVPGPATEQHLPALRGPQGGLVETECPLHISNVMKAEKYNARRNQTSAKNEE